MTTPFVVLLSSAYVMANALCVAAYLPQIWQVWTSSLARDQVVLTTWWAWTFGGLTELGYAAWVAHEAPWTAVALGHVLACGTVAVLGTCARFQRWLKRGHEKGHPEVALDPA